MEELFNVGLYLQFLLTLSTAFVNLLEHIALVFSYTSSRASGPGSPPPSWQTYSDTQYRSRYRVNYEFWHLTTDHSVACHYILIAPVKGFLRSDRRHEIASSKSARTHIYVNDKVMWVDLPSLRTFTKASVQRADVCTYFCTAFIPRYPVNQLGPT